MARGLSYVLAMVCAMALACQVAAVCKHQVPQSCIVLCALCSPLFSRHLPFAPLTAPHLHAASQQWCSRETVPSNVRVPVLFAVSHKVRPPQPLRLHTPDSKTAQNRCADSLLLVCAPLPAFPHERQNLDVLEEMFWAIADRNSDSFRKHLTHDELNNLVRKKDTLLLTHVLQLRLTLSVPATWLCARLATPRALPW